MRHLWLPLLLWLSLAFASEEAESGLLRTKPQDVHPRKRRLMTVSLDGLYSEEDPDDAIPVVHRTKPQRGLSKSKGGVSTSGTCGTVRVFVLKTEINKATFNFGTGQAFKVNVYEKGSKGAIGSWYESVQFTDFINDKEGFAGKDGMGFVQLMFNRNTVVTMEAPVDQRELAITGGSGRFGRCAGGFARPIREQANKVFFDLNICLTC